MSKFDTAARLPTASAPRGSANRAGRRRPCLRPARRLTSLTSPSGYAYIGLRGTDVRHHGCCRCRAPRHYETPPRFSLIWALHSAGRMLRTAARCGSPRVARTRKSRQHRARGPCGAAPRQRKRASRLGLPVAERPGRCLWQSPGADRRSRKDTGFAVLHHPRRRQHRTLAEQRGVCSAARSAGPRAARRLSQHRARCACSTRSPVRAPPNLAAS